MANKIQCKYCNYLTNRGRTESQKGSQGRKLYHCKHTKLLGKINTFIGYGDDTLESALTTMKSTPRWCPRKAEKEGCNNEN